MIRNASRIWGYSDTQDINSFDPLVGMLIDSLTEELYKLYSESEKSEGRIAERLLELVFNQSNLSYSPAYGLVQAIPTEAVVAINEKFQFSVSKRIERVSQSKPKSKSKEIFFTPTGDFKLHKGEIGYLDTGKELFETNGHHKELLGEHNKNFVPDKCKLSLGIQLDPKIENLDRFILYFSIRNRERENHLFQVLARSEWHVNGLPIKVEQGLDQGNQKDKKDALLNLFVNHNDISFKSKKYVNEYFENKFFTLTSSNILSYSDSKAYYLPEGIKKGYPQKVLKIIAKGTTWIEIDLGVALSDDIVGDLVVQMNCFPIINRELKEFNQSISKGLNIIALSSNDNFYDIFEISDSRGKFYYPMQSLNVDEDRSESYYVTNSNVGRFDERDSREAIDQLNTLIQNEGAAFATIGRDLITSELKELDQVLNRLKQRMEANLIPDDGNSFVFLNTSKNSERAFVKYWTTAGEVANNIRAGTNMVVNMGPDIEPSLLLLTSTTGGRHKLTKDDKLNKLRMSILSKGRIVTKEDIIIACFDYFGSILNAVEVINGVMMSQNPESGLVRCLDVILEFEDTNIISEELNYQIQGIEVFLNQSSSSIVPYRIILADKK
jgi:hypothetical protein